MNAPNAKAIIEAILTADDVYPMERPTMGEYAKLGKLLVAGEHTYFLEWNTTRCAVCGGTVEPKDRHSSHFNFVCGEHQEFGVYFQLRTELETRDMPPPPRCPDFWDGCE